MNRRPRYEVQEPFSGYQDEDPQLIQERAEGRRIRDTALEAWRDVWRQAPGHENARLSANAGKQSTETGQMNTQYNTRSSK